MKIKNPETGEVIVIPQGMEDAVRDAIESGNDPMEAMQMKYGGIHINPANKGKFNATKKATGKTTEELTHSKNPLTRKRAIFAQNAKKWKHQEGGQAMQQQQPQGGGQEDQMQQLVQMAEQALAQGASPEKVAQMLVQQGVPEQVVQQIIQYAIQDLQQQAQGQNPQEEAQEQGQQQNPQEEQDEMKYGGIHIKESKKGTFTAAATKHGMGVQEFAKKVLANKDNYSPAMVKKANFAHNAASWHHEYGGMAMYEEGGQLPESLLRTRMKASGASNEEINDYISKNYNYGGMTMYDDGGMIKRADGSYSKRGLWDNIRANKGSGKAPTKEMLKQEKKIKAAEKGMGGMMYADGGKLPKDILKSRLESHMSPQEVNNYLKEYANGGSFDNPGFRALPTYVQEKIKSNMAYGGCMECGGKMETGGRFLRKAQVGLYDDNLPYNPEYNSANSLNTFGNFQNPLEQYSFNDAYNPNRPIYPQTQFSQKTNNTFISPKNPIPQQDLIDSIPLGGYDQFGNIKSPQGLQGYNPETGGNLGLKNSMTTIGNIPSTIYNGKQYDTKNNKSNKFNDYAGNLANITGGNSYFGRGIQHLGQATFDFTKGGIEMAGNNISNRNALQDEANNLRSSMRAGYQKTGKRPTDGNAIISKYGGKMMQDGGATYADKMKVSKNSPEADFIAEKGEYIVNNGIASKLETGGSHASGNDTAISLDKSQSPSYVLSDTPRLKQLQFGGKRVSPAKYAEMATVEALGKTPDQILKGYTAFTKRAGTEGKVFGDKISNATNQLLAQKYQKDLATVKQIADQAYHKQEQLKYAMGMDNDLDHAQEVNGMSMAKFGGMQDGVHMNYFNAPAVQYGGSPQLFSDPSGLGYNTTQMGYGGMPMAYGGLPKMQYAGPFGNFQNPLDQYNPDKLMKRPDPYKNNELSQEGYESIEDYMKGRDKEYAIKERGMPNKKQLYTKYNKIANEGVRYNSGFFYKGDPEKKIISSKDLPELMDYNKNDFEYTPAYPDRPELLGMSNDDRDYEGMRQYQTKENILKKQIGIIGKETWDKFPDNLKMQLYNYIIDTDGDTGNIWKTLANAINSSKGVETKFNPNLSFNKEKDAKALEEAIKTIQNNKVDDKVYDTYINKVLPEEYKNLALSNHSVPYTKDSLEEYTKKWSNKPREIDNIYRTKNFHPTDNTKPEGKEVNLTQNPSNVNWGQSNWGKSVGTVGTSPNAAVSYDAQQSIYPESYSREENSQQNNKFNMVSPGQTAVNPTPAVVAGSSKVTTPAKNIGTTDYKIPISSGTSSGTALASNSNVLANVPASTVTTPTSGNNATATNANTSTTTTTATPTGTKTTTAINNDKLGIYNKKAVNKYNIDYNPMNKAGNDLWTDANYKTQWIPKVDNAFSNPENAKILIDRLENYSGQDANDVKLALSKAKTFEEKVAIAKRLATDYKPGPYHSIVNSLIDEIPKEPVKTPKPEAKESKPPVVESQEVDKKPFEYTPAEEKETYDIPPVNFYIPQSYGRNPIGLQLAQAQTIRPAKLNIQPELNEYNRSMRGALRGTQGNTSVNVAQQMQGLNNLYDAQNKLFGQKYNFDEQSRMGADQFNAQAIMNTDAANLQRIAAEQDAIARREGILDTQRRTDFQAGLENADKQNAYNLSKKYIESTFGPYLNNEGKFNFVYNPLTAEKNTKEKSYTASELNKMTAEQRKALGLKFGGSVKKIKLKLRK